MVLEIIFSILSVASLVFCALIVVDRTIFQGKVRLISIGMTGKEIEELTGFKLTILEIGRTSYSAQVRSMLTIFKCKLVFHNGRLVNKQSL